MLPDNRVVATKLPGTGFGKQEATYKNTESEVTRKSGDGHCCLNSSLHKGPSQSPKCGGPVLGPASSWLQAAFATVYFAPPPALGLSHFPSSQDHPQQHDWISAIFEESKESPCFPLHDPVVAALQARPFPSSVYLLEYAFENPLG